MLTTMEKVDSVDKRGCLLKNQGTVIPCAVRNYLCFAQCEATTTATTIIYI
jgi:hypothetical protein